MMITRTQAKNRFKKLLELHKYDDKWTGNICPVCGEKIPLDGEWQYSKTKRGTEVFFHTWCVGRWGL